MSLQDGGAVVTIGRTFKLELSLKELPEDGREKMNTGPTGTRLELPAH